MLSEKKFNVAYIIRKRFNAINKKELHIKVQYIKFNNIKKFLNLKKKLKLRGVTPKYIIKYIPE